MIKKPDEACKTLSLVERTPRARRVGSPEHHTLNPQSGVHHCVVESLFERGHRADSTNIR